MNGIQLLRGLIYHCVVFKTLYLNRTRGILQHPGALKTFSYATPDLSTTTPHPIFKIHAYDDLTHVCTHL
jgi:hypothetical protein